MGEPMTGAQASYLKTLSEEAHDPDAFDPDLKKAESIEAHRPTEEGDGASGSAQPPKPNRTP
jgi:hypothetical protein